MTGCIRWIVSIPHVRPGFEQRRTFERQRNAFAYAESATKEGYNPEDYVHRQRWDGAAWVRA